MIDAFVAKLDLIRLGFDKAVPKNTGRPSYDPADQLKLYLYGYFQRIRSSRRHLAELDEADKAELGETIDRSAIKTALEQLEARQLNNLTCQALMNSMGIEQFNTGESDARMMRTPKGPRVAYNVQTAVDAEQCTDAQRRYVSRHAHEDAFERMEQRMQAHPEMMVSRRSIVEHPFDNLKQWLFGNGRFLLRQLAGARAEMALAVNAYNLKRAINVLGVRRMMELMG